MLQRACDRGRARGDRRPPWTLLVESREPGVVISDFGAFRDAGFVVSACGGPNAEAGECPAVRGEPCALLNGADVVLFDLDGDRSVRSTVLTALREARPDVPLVVRSARPDVPVDVWPARRDAGPARGCTTIPTTTSVNGQVAALQKAVLRCPARRP